MKILYEDNDVIVCVKPVGLISQSDVGGTKSMISILSEYTDNEVYPLHRLDKEVGGVMVYAKTHIAAAKLSADIAGHRFNKEYLAVIHGIIQPETGKMTDLLFKDSKKNKSYVVKRMRKGVRQAELNYKIIESKEFENENYSLLNIKLITGRTHQIRVQFASRGYPLVGDKKYGAHDNSSNILLYSHKISFIHPLSGLKMEFSSKPENFKIF